MNQIEQLRSTLDELYRVKGGSYSAGFVQSYLTIAMAMLPKKKRELLIAEIVNFAEEKIAQG